MSSHIVAVFGSSQTQPDTAEWTDAIRVGRRLGAAGVGVVTGGYGGTMEAASLGAGQQGVPVVGVTAPALFPGRVEANPYVSDLIEAPNLTTRIGEMLSVASGAIALPGSIGTATELLIIWNSNHIARRSGGIRFPIVAVGQEWRRVGRALAQEVGAVTEDVIWTDDVDVAVDWLVGELETLTSEVDSPNL